MSLDVETLNGLKTFKRIRICHDLNIKKYTSYLKLNYPRLNIHSQDDDLDTEIYNKVDVLSALNNWNDPNSVWRGLIISVCKMGYFGVYSRLALTIELRSNYCLTFNQFMHVYPFLKEISLDLCPNDIITSDNFKLLFDHLREVYSSMSNEEIETLITQKYPLSKLKGGWCHILSDQVPIWETYGRCTFSGCPAIVKILVDPIHNLVFIRYLVEHYNCGEFHKKKIYDIIKKCFVRFGGDLELINNLYVDMPRRYGIGFVESSLSLHSSINNKRLYSTTFEHSLQQQQQQQQSHNTTSWASTLKRRIMYDLQPKPSVLDSLNSNIIDFYDQPEWRIHMSNKINDDLIKIYKDWRSQYFKKHDLMWESLTNKNWFQDFQLVKKYWELAELRNVNFQHTDDTRPLAIIMEKDKNALLQEKIWFICEDKSTEFTKPLPKKFQDLSKAAENWNNPFMDSLWSPGNNNDQISNNNQNNNDIRNQPEIEANSNLLLPGVSNIVKSVLSSYEGDYTDLKLYRINAGVKGRNAGFIICPSNKLWESIYKMLNISSFEELNQKITILTTSNLSETQSLPSQIKLLTVDFFKTSIDVQSSAVNKLFPRDILNELSFSMIEFSNSKDGSSFSKVRELIKSKIPRQRANANDPLSKPLELSSPIQFNTHEGRNEMIIRVGHLIGTARISSKSMLKTLDFIELNAYKWTNEDADIEINNKEDQLLVELQRIWTWILTNRRLCDLHESDVTLLKFLWLFDLKCNNFNDCKIGFGDDLLPNNNIKFGPRIKVRGKGLLGLVKSLSEWEQC